MNTKESQVVLQSVFPEDKIFSVQQTADFSLSLFMSNKGRGRQQEGLKGRLEKLLMMTEIERFNTSWLKF
jgi:hypothetical protein